MWAEVKDRLGTPGGALSGGQQQRLCIARSLAVNPDVLLMDEPCSALDPTSTRRIEETIAVLRDQVTIVIVTHNMQQAARVSQQCAFFLAEQGTPGQIVESGATRTCSSDPQRPANRRLRERALRVTTPLEPPPSAPAPDPDDVPRELDPGLPRLGSDLPRHRRAASAPFVLVLTGSIGLFLGYQLIPTLHQYGCTSSPRTSGSPERTSSASPRRCSARSRSRLIALVIAFPLALLTALYISEYAPPWLKPSLVTLVDLMAAVPSIVYGVWGVVPARSPTRCSSLAGSSSGFGWIPLFKVHGRDPHAAARSPALRSSCPPFIAGLVVAMMVIPLGCAVMRNVFAQAPIGEREAAYALGSTRWGMIRSVVLPFGRGGIIGGTMLGLGRALGETVAVLLIISLDFGHQAPASWRSARSRSRR